MTDSQLQRMAQAAAVIRQVVGDEFQWEQPGLREYGKGALMVLIHEPGSRLRPYCNYDCAARLPDTYGWIDELTDALSVIGLYVEDCTGDYSGVYEATPLPKEVSDA